MHVKSKLKKKKPKEITKRLLRTIRFDGHIDFVFDKLTEEQNYLNSYVIRNRKHTMKIQEIGKNIICNFDDKG